MIQSQIEHISSGEYDRFGLASVGRAIRARRMEYGMSIAALAKSAHVSRGTIARLERGRYVRLPTQAVLSSVTRALGRDQSWLARETWR